jgi:hypothetical protein
MRRIPLASLFALLCLSSAGRADVLPPDKKQVDYTFVVTGFASNAEQVLFAYPCSNSPMPDVDAYRKLEDGRVEPAGSRSGACAIYAASKSGHDAFAAGYKPTGTTKDPALDAFVASATKCTGAAPAPTTFIDASDPRTAINESFVVRTLTATECALDSTTPPPPSKSSSKGCSVGPPGRAASTFALAVAFAAFAAFALRRDRRG